VVVQRVLTPGAVAFPVDFAILLLAAGAVLFVSVGAISLVPERYVQARHAHHVETGDGGGPRQVREILRCDGAFRRMLLARLLTGADQMAVPFYTVLALTVLKLPPESVGWFVAAQTVGTLLGPVLFGRIAERAGAQRVILAAAVAQLSAPLIGLLFVSLGNAALAIGAGIALVFVATGLSNSSMALGYFNYLLDFCPAHDRPTYLAILSTVGMASMLMPVLGGVIAQTVSYAPLFVVTAVLVGAGAVVALTLPDKRSLKAISAQTGK
jgi:MFS family permease